MVDISEYRTTLELYRTQGYQGLPELALKDLGQRIYALHDNAYYVRSPERDLMKRLLCRYHLRRSIVASELSYHSGALDHLNKAVILAQEENFLDLEAYALEARGEFFFLKGNLPRALKDLKDAQSKMESAPRQVRGTILRLRGLTDAYLAKTDTQFSKARLSIDASDRYITPQPDQKISGGTLTNDAENDIRLNCTEVRHQLDRAKALVAPADRKLHSSEEAYKIIDEILQKSDPTQKRLHGYHTLDHYLILAQYYLDKGYCPMAVTQIENALTQMEEMDSLVHLPTVVRLYEQLVESSYGKEVAVAELGLQLLFVQDPWLLK